MDKLALFKVTSIDWTDVFSRIRNAAGYPKPGYLTHEAVQWSDIHKKWFFLPRKASKTIYREEEDQWKGCNLLITSCANLCSFNITEIEIIGYRHPERGYSSFDFIPDTNDELIVALKSEEVDGRKTKSFITVFSINGTVLLKDSRLEDEYKFEGIYFV
ncbi:unnamed protein product [Strongylus vulgaris]|uniref:Uncharacterized protein n=1 Tax=Strongylus vulgaris TaxID=40348 RepID=A0A3P7IXL5_STRVU|nr:unnamed protein product [Strongylus vulgaris]